MKAVRYFDDRPLGIGLAPSAIQAMARRQFNISLVVAAAVLAVAGLRTVSRLHEWSSEMALWHEMDPIEAARTPVPPPSFAAITEP
jgi:hypothetical protein